MTKSLGKRLDVRQKLKIWRGSKPKKTALCTLIKDRYAKGKTPAEELHDVARAADSQTPSLAQFTKGRERVRVRGGKMVPASRNSARSATRLLAKDARFREPYMAQIPAWDEVKNERTMVSMAILPIHESLDGMIPEGRKYEWTSFSLGQKEFPARFAEM